MSDSTYNGWTNRATWALNLHMNNTYGWYQDFTSQADFHVAEADEGLADGDYEDADDARSDAIDKFSIELETWLDEMYGLIEEAATTPGESVGSDAWMLLMDVGSDTSAINYGEIATTWINDNLDGRLSGD